MFKAFRREYAIHANKPVNTRVKVEWALSWLVKTNPRKYLLKLLALATAPNLILLLVTLNMGALVLDRMALYVACLSLAFTLWNGLRWAC